MRKSHPLQRKRKESPNESEEVSTKRAKGNDIIRDYFDDSDLGSRENWGGHAAPHYFYQEPWDVGDEAHESKHNITLSSIHNDHDYSLKHHDRTTDEQCFSDTPCSRERIPHESSPEDGVDNPVINVKDTSATDINNVVYPNKVKEEVTSSANITSDRTKVVFQKQQQSQSKFFVSCPEVKLLNQQNTFVKSHLLRNGSCLSAVRGIPGGQLLVKNTCGFDSIAQILYTSASDDSKYMSIVENSTAPFFKFTKLFINTGPTVAVYKKRAQILKPFYKAEIKTISTDERVVVRSMDVKDCLVRIWRNLLKTEPSAHETILCNVCGASTQLIATLDSRNHKLIIEQGFGALQSAMQFETVSYNRPCTRSDCHGCTTHAITTNHHVFIELDIRKGLHSE